jgi:beta-lactam-binding protein with PASTA domain
MPDLKGLTLRQALQSIAGLELEVNVTGSGQVVGQSPPPGTLVQPNALCVLNLEREYTRTVSRAPQ